MSPHAENTHASAANVVPKPAWRMIHVASPRWRVRIARLSARSAIALLVFAFAACGGDDDALTATGTLELIELDAAPLQPARVVAVRVREGDVVRAGDTLATLTQTVEIGRAHV